MLHIFGGGTVNHVRNHLALCAPAYGSTARQLYRRVQVLYPDCPAQLELTRMADSASVLETNAEVAARLEAVLAAPSTHAIVFNVALCDFEGQIGDEPSGKYAPRLKSREGEVAMRLTPADKLLHRIKARRPDVVLVGFKTTAGATHEEQVRLALRQIEETGANFVHANDTVTRENCLVSATRTLVGTRDKLLDLVAFSLASSYRSAL